MSLRRCGRFFFIYIFFLCCLKGQTKLCRKKNCVENINTYSTRQTKRSKKKEWGLDG